MVERPVLFRNARLIDPSCDLDAQGFVLVQNGKIADSGTGIATVPEGAEVVDCSGLILSPGIVDMRVFIGEPGSEHCETIESASHAAAAGGVTTMVSMPDTDPVIDDIALVDFLLRRARDTAIVHIRPMAAITFGLKGEHITEFGLLRDAGAIGLTDGRCSIRDTYIMRQALVHARNFGMLIQHHCEDQYLARNGLMNEGAISTRLGLPGIPNKAESIIVARDTQLAVLTQGRYHVAQVSCEDSLDIIRQTKKIVDHVTCGVSVNHITLNENDIGDYRSFFKTSPPLRTEDQRCAMVEGLRDGTIDVIVSSHDPQHVETKRLPFSEAANGTIGLETLLAASLRLVHDGSLSLLRVIHALSTRPAELLGLECGTLRPGSPADITIFDMDEPWVVMEHAIKSHSKNTPYEGACFQGKVKRTMVDGRTVYVQ